jgi:hypothetical protein
VQHQRGLAGPVGPEGGHALAMVHPQVDAEQGLVAVRVGVGESLDLEGRRGPLPGHGVQQALRATSAATAGSSAAADHGALEMRALSSAGIRPL